MTLTVDGKDEKEKRRAHRDITADSLSQLALCVLTDSIVRDELLSTTAGW